MSQNRKNILIIGMTGVGKTTIGRLIAKKLNKKFFDSDHEIELASGLRINDFFTKFGEKEFRKLEKKIITKLINQNKNIVISTGAGFLSNTKFNKFVFSESICIFLNAKIETLYQRLIGNIRNRPKLNEGNLKENLKKMHKSRTQEYMNAQIKIEVDELSIADILTLILDYLKENERI
ncbi:MAG: shikimate kinase [Rickettsiales bacterium]|nr:shikimate kinase [Rickettsiales bacterium]